MKLSKIWILIILFSVIYSLFSTIRHLRLETDIFDLGYYDQLIWLYGHGSLYSSILEVHAWVDHFTPSLFLLSPLFIIWDSPIILLIFQSVFICLGSYPIYKLTLKKLKRNDTALIISFAYLAFFGVQNAISYDFHPIAIATPLIGWLVWFYDKKSYKAFWIILMVFVGLQENCFLLAGALGFFLILQYRDFRRGLFIIISSVISLFFIVKVLMPSLGSNYYYYPTHLDNLSIREAITLLYTPSTKLEVLLLSFGSFGFLPVISFGMFPFFVEEFGGRFVGTLNIHRWVMGYHYDVTLAAIMAIATIFVLAKWSKKTLLAANYLIIIGTLISIFYVKSDIKRIFSKSFYSMSHTRDTYEVLSSIPADASVAATNNLGAQLAHRKNIIFLTNCIDNPKVWGEDGKRCFNLKPDYIVGDFSKDNGSNDYYPDYSKDRLIEYLKTLEKEGEYKLIQKKGETLLYKKI